MNNNSAFLTRSMPTPELIRSARLPEIYQGAKMALAECTKKDECMDWANKAEALASYARQAGDEELRKMADRIQARAIQRCGQLLKEIESQQGKRNQYTVPSNGGATKQSRGEAADEAGMSKRQNVTAIRVSNIPSNEFEQAIESDDPPTVTALAEQGKQSRPKPIVDLEGMDPADYAEGTRLLGILANFRRESSHIDIESALSGLKKFEAQQLIKDCQHCLNWVGSLIERI